MGNETQIPNVGGLVVGNEAQDPKKSSNYSEIFLLPPTAVLDASFLMPATQIHPTMSKTFDRISADAQWEIYTNSRIATSVRGCKCNRIDVVPRSNEVCHPTRH